MLDDPATKTWSAPWETSLTVTTDATWPPGQYLLRLESSDGGATFVPMVIRDDGSRSGILMQSAVTTWQAYNGWGGASLYQGNNGRADVVSFDRPYTGNGSGEFLGREYEFIYLVERLGLDVSYWTDVDLHERGQLATNHKAVVIPGHDEYYTVEMRQNLEAARDAGVNLGFFGANNVYRRIRLEPSSIGPSRHEVNYRDASRDPLNGIDPTRVTTSFREAPAANPESSLIGNYYECNPVKADWVVGDPTMWMFEGSGFTKGERVPGMVGNEYDRVTAGVPTPENIQVLAHSPVDCKGLQSYADSHLVLRPQRGRGVLGRHVRLVTAARHRLPARAAHRAALQGGQGHREHPPGLRRRTGRRRPPERLEPGDVRHPVAEGGAHGPDLEHGARRRLTHRSSPGAQAWGVSTASTWPAASWYPA